MLGIGLSLTGRLKSSASIPPSFSPSTLFSLSEPGIWLDPSDVANLAWRRNLLTFTEQFDNAAWTKVSLTVTANGSTAPDNTATGDRIIESNDGSTVTTHSITSAVSLTAGLQYVFSFYAKGASSGRHVWVGGGGIGGAAEYPIFNVTGGSVDLAATTTIVKSATISAPDANGWRRCSVTFVPTATTAPGIGLTASATDNASVGYIGNGISGVDIWGAQLELGSVATDYQRISDVNTEVIERFPSATLYQDPAGTLPVTTPGQTVAIALDKSKGLVLGADTVINGDFATDTNWTKGAGWTISGGKASKTSGVSSDLISNAVVATAGLTYLVTFTLSDITAGSVVFYNGFGGTGNITPSLSANGTYRYYLRGGTDGKIYVNASSTFVGSIDNISVKELPGFHATQATLASRPTYGIVPLGGRRNRLLSTNDLSTASWARVSISSVVGATSPDANSAWTITTSGTDGGIAQGDSGIAGAVKTHQIRAKAGTSSTFRFQDTVAGNGAYVDFNLSAITAGSPVTAGTGGVTISSATIVDDGGGWRLCTITATRSSGPGNFYIIVVGASGSTMTFRMPQAEAGSSATAYQRVGSAFDVTEAGVASLSYLSFDGVDDFMVTPTITPGIDKAQVFAGVRKLSDVAIGVVVEHGTGVSPQDLGAFYVAAPQNTGASGDFTLRSIGTTARLVVSGTILAPATRVITGVADISGDQLTLRLNGSQIAQSLLDQGSGNYGNYPLYIGRRAGTSLPFNGQLYSLLVRFGTNLDAGTITSTETWVSGKTGIDISKIISPTIFARDETAILDRFNATIERRAV